MHHQIQTEHRSRQGLGIHHRLHPKEIDQKFQRLRRRKTDCQVEVADLRVGECNLMTTSAHPKMYFITAVCSVPPYLVEQLGNSTCTK